MNSASLFWIMIYLVSAGLFFGIAVAITIFGLSDLRSLLSKSKRKEPQR